MHEQAVLSHTDQATQERLTHPTRLVVTVDKRLGMVGERVEVLPSLYGTVVLSYDHGCQVWLRSVDVQAWAAHCSE
jgi:hypothetical protein